MQVLKDTGAVEIADIFVVTMSTGNISMAKNLIVDGGDIGITADTDLIQLSSNTLVVNAGFTATNSGGGHLITRTATGGSPVLTVGGTGVATGGDGRTIMAISTSDNLAARNILELQGNAGAIVTEFASNGDANFAADIIFSGSNAFINASKNGDINADVITGTNVKSPLFSSPSTMAIRTGSSGTIFMDLGANLTIRDLDDSFATRTKMDSATGDWDIVSGDFNIATGQLFANLTNDDAITNDVCFNTTTNEVVYAAGISCAEATPILQNKLGKELRKVASNLRELEGVSKIRLDGYDAESDFSFILANEENETQYYDAVFLNERCHVNGTMFVSKKYSITESGFNSEAWETKDGLYLQLNEGEGNPFTFEQPASSASCDYVDFELEVHGFYEKLPKQEAS